MITSNLICYLASNQGSKNFYFTVAHWGVMKPTESLKAALRRNSWNLTQAVAEI